MEKEIEKSFEKGIDLHAELGLTMSYAEIKELCKEIITKDLDVNAISAYQDMIILFDDLLYRRISSNKDYTSRLGNFCVWNRLYDPENIDSVTSFRNLFTYEPLKSKCPEFNRPFIGFGLSEDSDDEYPLNLSDKCYIDAFVFDDELWNLYKSKKKELSDALEDTVEDVICLDPFKPLESNQVSDIIAEMSRCGYDNTYVVPPVKRLIDDKFKYRVHLPKYHSYQRVCIYDSLDINDPKQRNVRNIVSELVSLDKFLESWHYDTTRSIEDVQKMANEVTTRENPPYGCHVVHSYYTYIASINFNTLQENFDTIEISSQCDEAGLLYECLNIIRETCVPHENAYSVDYTLSKSTGNKFELRYTIYYNGEMTNPPIKDSIIFPSSIMEELYKKHGITMSADSISVN